MYSLITSYFEGFPTSDIFMMPASPEDRLDKKQPAVEG